MAQEDKGPHFEPMKLPVSDAHLHPILQALNGDRPTLYIREMLATRSICRLSGDPDYIGLLTDEYNQWQKRMKDHTFGWVVIGLTRLKDAFEDGLVLDRDAWPVPLFAYETPALAYAATCNRLMAVVRVTMDGLTWTEDLETARIKIEEDMLPASNICRDAISVVGPKGV